MDSALIAAAADIAKLCALHGVERLDVFGSAAADTPATPPNDYDFVVQLADSQGDSKARRWLALAQGLELVLGKPVDLVSAATIRNPHFARALHATRVALYERPRPQAAV